MNFIDTPEQIVCGHALKMPISENWRRTVYFRDAIVRLEAYADLMEDYRESGTKERFCCYFFNQKRRYFYLCDKYRNIEVDNLSAESFNELYENTLRKLKSISLVNVKDKYKFYPNYQDREQPYEN